MREIDEIRHCGDVAAPAQVDARAGVAAAAPTVSEALKTTTMMMVVVVTVMMTSHSTIDLHCQRNSVEFPFQKSTSSLAWWRTRRRRLV
jgi:hypothetical protein